jgi:hypothetical protein
MTGIRTNSGKKVQVEWSIPARQTRFHKDGTFYMPLTAWPGALADTTGYVVFETETDLLKHARYWGDDDASTRRIGVREGISKLAAYVKVKPLAGTSN